jgi:hypothetical protein
VLGGTVRLSASEGSSCLFITPDPYPKPGMTRNCTLTSLTSTEVGETGIYRARAVKKGREHHLRFVDRNLLPTRSYSNTISVQMVGVASYALVEPGKRLTSISLLITTPSDILTERFSHNLMLDTNTHDDWTTLTA